MHVYTCSVTLSNTSLLLKQFSSPFKMSNGSYKHKNLTESERIKACIVRHGYLRSAVQIELSPVLVLCTQRLSERTV